MNIRFRPSNFASLNSYKYLMNRIFTTILALVFLSLISAQDSSNRFLPEIDDVDDLLTSSKQVPNYVPVPNSNGIREDRLPQLMKDVKLLLSETIIADYKQDTLEVLYNLEKIFELLQEADQFGEMNADDKEEFSRFESTLTHVYTHSLTTLNNSENFVTAQQIREEIDHLVDPVEIEMGNSKFIIVKDRDGHIPLVRNKKVDQYINYFQNRGRRQFEIWLSRYEEYGELIRGILREKGMPEELVYLAMVESGLNPKAYSKANASGMWQFIYATGKKYGLDRNWYLDERRDPVKSTHAAADYLKDLFEEFDDWYLALAAYNCGSGRVSRSARLHQTYDFWQLHSLPRETRNYIPYFLSVAIIASDPEQYGFKRANGDSPLKWDEVELEKSADLSVIARAAETNFKTIQKYNPELRQSATPAVEGYVIKLPEGKKEIFIENFIALPENQRFAPQYVTHRVQNGESLWTIAKKYNVSIHDLASVNKILNRHRIKIGQKLTIPVKGGEYPASDGPSGHFKVVYSVKKGDTLGHIAENYKTRAMHIRKWNNLSYGQYIYPGQKLILWVRGG